MRTINDIIEILEKYLKDKKLSLRQFSLLVDIPHSTILTWKKKNTLPSMEFMSKIADFMNVSLDWLVNGVIAVGEENTLDNVYSRRCIFHRIENVLKEDKVDNDIESLYSLYLEDIVDFEVLINWVAGRANIAEDVLPKIATKINVPLQWLLSGDEYHQEDFNAHIYGLATKYPGLLKGYSCLDEEDQKFIDHYIVSRLEVRQLKREAKHDKKDCL